MVRRRVFENSYKTHKDSAAHAAAREKIRPPTPNPEQRELCGAFYLPDKISPEADCPVIMCRRAKKWAYLNT